MKKTINNHHTVHPDNPEDSDDSSDTEEEDKDKRWLETSWCKMDMPTAEQQLFVDLNTPEQVKYNVVHFQDFFPSLFLCLLLLLFLKY